MCRDSGDPEGRKIAARGAPPTFCLVTLLTVGVAPVRHLALRFPRSWIMARNEQLCPSQDLSAVKSATAFRRPAPTPVRQV